MAVRKMQFLDTINAVLNLDLGWFVWLVEANLLWVFLFALVMVFFQARKKNRVFYLVMLVLMLYAAVEFIHFIGWHLPPMLQFPLIAVNIAIIAFEDHETISKHKSIIGLGVFWILLVIFQFFL